ncbi:hypothetical protein [Yoonia sp. 2307UL14-13]|uniref:hypothetical protein n=1 Tax=Yoonia sp. 2307UL14-13 TaxID=3126506 RepID=UPI0030A886EA
MKGLKYMRVFSVTHRLTVVLSVSFLASCGGGGSSDAPVSRFDLNSHAEILDVAFELAEEREGASITPFENVPTVGSTTYEGIMFMSIQESDVPTLLGQAYLDIDFQDASVNGAAGNFHSIPNGATEGSLTFRDGSIRRSGSFYRISVNYTGDIDFDDKPRSVSGNLAGSLTGPEGEFFVTTYVGVGTDAGGNEDGVVGSVALNR